MNTAQSHGPWMADPPREVPRWFFVRRMQAMVFSALLFVGLGIVMGVGLPVLFYFLGGRVSPTVDLSLDRVHGTASATLSDKAYIRHVHIGSRHPWRLDFAFTTSDGVTVSTTGYTFEETAATLEPGDALDIEYDPDDPTRARPVGGSASLCPLWVYGLMLAVVGPELVAGVILALATAYLARTERVLLAYGVGTDAEVVDVRPVKWINFGAKHPYEVAYRFVDHRGMSVTGSDRTYHYDWARNLSAGQRVGVVYNPRDPSANVLWLHGNESASTPERTAQGGPEGPAASPGGQPFRMRPGGRQGEEIVR